MQEAVTREPVPLALPAGVSLAVDAGVVAGSDCALARLRRQVFDALAGGAPVTLSVHGIAAGAQANDELALLCRALGAAVADAAVPSANVVLTLPAACLSPAAVLAVRHANLGAGMTYLRTGTRTFVPPPDSVATAAAFWHELWQLRGTGEIACTYADVAAPACPLLSAERACAVLPPLALHCPAGSAWAWLPFDVATFADDKGSVDEAALASALENVIAACERLHDGAAWPTAAMRNDAWRNRRLAVLLTGFGDIAARMGRWPADRPCLMTLTALLLRIRRLAIDYSRELAHADDMLPALTEHDPVAKLGSAAQPAWRARWRRALAAVGTRHRNLLAMSPASLLPAHAAFDRASFELLPLLEHADVWCAAPVSLQSGLNFNEFIELHRRSWAVLQRRNGRRLVAEQV